MEIYKKLALVMNDLEPIAKDKTNKEQHYQFRGIDALMNAISPILSKHGVIPATHNIETITDGEVVSRGGAKGYREVRRFTFRFYAEDGSFIETKADGESIDYGDKGSNKCNSVAYREAMFKLFVVPFASEDIEDVNHDLQSEAPKQAAKPSVVAQAAPKAPVVPKPPVDELTAAKNELWVLLGKPSTQGRAEDDYQYITGDEIDLKIATLFQVQEAITKLKLKITK